MTKASIPQMQSACAATRTIHSHAATSRRRCLGSIVLCSGLYAGAVFSLKRARAQNLTLSLPPRPTAREQISLCVLFVSVTMKRIIRCIQCNQQTLPCSKPGCPDFARGFLVPGPFGVEVPWSEGECVVCQVPEPWEGGGEGRGGDTLQTSRIFRG